jgi:hypothetical protein
VKKIFGKREQIGGFPGKKVMVAGGKWEWVYSGGWGILVLI